MVRPLVPRLGVEVVEDLRQQVPVDASVQAVLQQNSLVPVAGWDHAAVHEVELDELCVGQVEVDSRQLSAATLGKSHKRERNPSSYSVRRSELVICRRVSANSFTSMLAFITEKCCSKCLYKSKPSFIEMLKAAAGRFFFDSEQVLGTCCQWKTQPQLHTWCRQNQQPLCFVIFSQSKSLSCAFVEQPCADSHWARLSVLRFHQEHKTAQQDTVCSCAVDK